MIKDKIKSLVIIGLAFVLCGGIVLAYSGNADIVVEGDLLYQGESLGGLNHNVMEDFSEGISVDGTTVIDGDGNWDGAITGTSATLSTTLAVTGASTFTGAIAAGTVVTDIFTQGGGCTVIATTSATRTITEAEMIAANCFEIQGVSGKGAAITITLPATSTMTTMLAAEGDMREWLIDDQHTAAATTTTIAAGAGIDLIGVTTDDDLIDGTEWARLSCWRQTDTDVTCIVSELIHVD